MSLRYSGKSTGLSAIEMKLALISGVSKRFERYDFQGCDSCMLNDSSVSARV